jgi:hypothetical protein
VQYSELTHYHLKQGSEFPNHQKLYNANFKSNARVSVWTDAQMRVSLYGQMRAYARLWDIRRARLCQRVREKFRIDFSPIFDEFDVVQVG